MTRLTAAVAVLFLFASCGPTTARSAAEGYLDALSRLDFSGAAHYVVDGKARFETLGKIYADLDPEEQKKFQVSGWKVTGETVVGDLASVDFTFDGEKKGQLSLRRVGGVWKVEPRRIF